MKKVVCKEIVDQTERQCLDLLGVEHDQPTALSMLIAQICLELNMINQLLFPGKVPSDQDVADLDSVEKILRYKSVWQKNVNKS